MYRPLYWYYGNVKFPDTEVEQVINELLKLSDYLGLHMEEDATSSYYLDVTERPDKIWQPRYHEIVENLTKSIGIHSTSKYIWDYWTQLYFPSNHHPPHTHWHGPSTISFVHFLKPTKENNFVFLDNDGKEHGLPEQSEGDLIFFPSYIWHSAKPLKSGRRFVVAGNIEIKFIEKDHPV